MARRVYEPEASEEWNRSPSHASRHAQGGADAIDGNDLFVVSDTAPSSPTGGDRFYDTTVDLWMVYDDTREQWLSEEIRQVQFQGGTIAAGAYFFAGNLQMGATLGIPAAKGTVVEVSFIRSDSDEAWIEVLETDGSTSAVLGELRSAASGMFRDSTLEWNFDKGALTVRVKESTNEMSNVIGVIFYRLRA